VRVHLETMNKQCGYEGRGCGEDVQIHLCTMSKQCGNKGGRMRRVCKGAPVHFGQTVREQGGGCGEYVWVHLYTMSKQCGNPVRDPRPAAPPR
jgi:hypothetical protein